MVVVCLSVFVFGRPGLLHRSSSYMKNNVVYGYTFIYNGNMGSGALLQCAILQARANSILWPASSSSSCRRQAGALHNNVVSCPQMLFHRPELISQTSPLLQFPKLLFPSLLPTRFHYVFRM